MIKDLCSVVIENNEEFAIHPEATHYRLKSGKIVFYKVNPSPSEKMRPIPEGTNTMRFLDFHRYSLWINYGEPEFIGHR